MAVQIRVVPDALREVAEKQIGLASKVEELGQSIQSVISILDQAWDGSASRVLLESLQEVKKSSESTQECMKENAEKVRNVAQAFEAVDENENVGFVAVKFDERKFTLLRCPRPAIIGTLVLKENSIRIVPEDVRAAAVRCSAISQEYMDIRVMLQQSIEELQANWEGNSYAKYSTGCTEVLNNLSEIDDVLSEISSKMRIAAMRYEEIDNSF